MEEKERFELFGEHCIKDNNPDARCQLLDAYVACVILNEQDKNIKELEEENQQLKQQLQDLPKKIVGEIRKEIGNELYSIIPECEYGFRLGIDWCEINRILDTILTKYNGE